MKDTLNAACVRVERAWSQVLAAALGSDREQLRLAALELRDAEDAYYALSARPS